MKELNKGHYLSNIGRQNRGPLGNSSNQISKSEPYLKDFLIYFYVTHDPLARD